MKLKIKIKNLNTYYKFFKKKYTYYKHVTS